VARSVISDPKRRAVNEPLYDIDPHTGASLEVFYADRVLAHSFGRSTGWFWWTCQRGFAPDGLPTGLFAASYAGTTDAISSRAVAKVLQRPRQAGVALLISP
jgi:hypothetical protein